jgi:hypothetical protein
MPASGHEQPPDNVGRRGRFTPESCRRGRRPWLPRWARSRHQPLPDKFVENLNIEHFRKRLADETDETKQWLPPSPPANGVHVAIDDGEFWIAVERALESHMRFRALVNSPRTDPCHSLTATYSEIGLPTNRLSSLCEDHHAKRHPAMSCGFPSGRCCNQSSPVF